MSLFGLIGQGLGLVSSIFAGNAAKKGADKAAQLQYDAAMRGIDESRRQYDTTRTDFMPWLDAGRGALGQQGNLLGLNGGGVQADAIEALRNSPWYQSMFRNGQETLLANASASGGLRGGNLQGASMDFGADLLASAIDRQLAQLGGLSGQGMQATGNVANFGQANTQNIIQGLNAGASAQAGAALTRGGINAGIWNNIGSFLQDRAMPAFGKLF